MQTVTVLAPILLVITSFPFVGQSPSQTDTPSAAGTEHLSAPATNPSPSTADAQAARPAPPPEMKPVSAELIGSLSTKTAKPGDSIVVLTESSVKTADGTDIPKGTKLLGHVVGAQSSTAGATAQIVLKFDHAELAGGKDLPIQSEIESLGAGDASANSTAAPATGAGRRAAVTAGNGPSPAANPLIPEQPSMSSDTQPSQSANAASGGSTGVEPGTVIATTGQIDIRTTAVPGVLVANNEPGHRDPRMAQASTVLLGANTDVQLSGGTPLVMGIATTAPALQVR